MGASRLLLAQAAIRDIEGGDDVGRDDAPPGGVGWIRVNRQTYPVYCLTEEFELTGAIPAARRICVLLSHADGPFGLLCDQLEVQEAPETFHPLPECMRLDGSPVSALVLQADGIACLSSVQRLAALIPHATRLPEGEMA
jgi:hypothetical protein